MRRKSAAVQKVTATESSIWSAALFRRFGFSFYQKSGGKAPHSKSSFATVLADITRTGR
jgi:hypothetical protein